MNVSSISSHAKGYGLYIKHQLRAIRFLLGSIYVAVLMSLMSLVVKAAVVSVVVVELK